jgi:hypothetical protein
LIKLFQLVQSLQSSLMAQHPLRLLLQRRQLPLRQLLRLQQHQLLLHLHHLPERLLLCQHLAKALAKEQLHVG